MNKAVIEESKDKEDKADSRFQQPDLNIGVVGHIDHGKTTLLQRMSGVWASRHSEELKRGITIKLGYADAFIRRCHECKKLTTAEKCECGDAGHTAQGSGRGAGSAGQGEIQRYVSFVDAPGHEMLMATMLSGAAIIDAAILVITANEKCPQPQTKEHLIALQAKGIKHIIIVQNKIDLLSREEILKNYQEIREFVKGTIAENAPILPISAQQGINIDFLYEEILKIPSPQRDTMSTPLFLIARTFDINRPGTEARVIVGGVFGGTLKQGTLKVGDKVEIVPGLVEEKGGRIIFKPMKTTISDLVSGKHHLKEALPAGSLAISTLLDPFFSKGDALAGNVIGLEGKTPAVVYELKLKINLFEKVVGAREETKVEPLKMNEALLLSINTSVTVGIITMLKGGEAKLSLKLPVAAIKGSNIGIARNLQGKWRLIGYGVIE
ncbi:MAG TPA: translation initiation factor IF-2 subunit gamma [Nanoarchaeota archaeon]|nr:translation initiation factor IF-2 subunit gamma [Candidatus Pacearchaeota archaeon]HIH17735.1 translation initiation factor IF-2 subunit gamma [Nanoarchaeota archaeon]HIH33799.1 translation initiation factor IF-2 subunit gamma [Nanoarchaeota archaeon]HIH51622.1 translation initiation factor IF-2 subunit gamma [Nanoarchaeota archaeon]HIH65687.1 translation initiation factor IF-2 subunit gamma [Nanoarchaeota archaeon]